MKPSYSKIVRQLSLIVTLATGQAWGAPSHPALPLIVAQAVAGGGMAADSLRPADRDFLVQAVLNGRMEAELSRLAVGQATASSVREFAEQLVADYGQMTGALQALAQRKTVALPLQPTSYPDAYRELAARTGAGFDRAFIQRIANANEHALRLCEAAVANAKDPDVRQLAGSFLPIVRDHVNKSTDLEKSL